MDLIWEQFTKWLKEVLVDGVMNNLTGLFDAVNAEVADIANQIGSTPQGWNAGIYNMIRSLSNNVILPIAGVILAAIATIELIQLITDKNNMHDVDTWMFLKWMFKTACAVLIVSNTWDIVMGVFDVAQTVIDRAAGTIIGSTSINVGQYFSDLEARLMQMDIAPLIGLWFETLFVNLTIWILVICIFLISYGRMIEIYLVTSVAPIPMATMVNREWGHMGTNYLRSLFALGFQGFLIIVCVAIYAVLVRTMIITTSITAAIWTCFGYTVLLCFTLFKTGSLAKSVFHAS